MHAVTYFTFSQVLLDVFLHDFRRAMKQGTIIITRNMGHFAPALVVSG